MWQNPQGAVGIPADQRQFVDLLCSDAELVRAEFDALIVAAELDAELFDGETLAAGAEAEQPTKPPPGAPPRLDEPQPSAPTGSGATRPRRSRIGRVACEGMLRWRRQRSPPLVHGATTTTRGR